MNEVQSILTGWAILRSGRMFRTLKVLGVVYPNGLAGPGEPVR